eukprot:g19403.t1
MRRKVLTGGGGILSLGVVWSQALCAKASNDGQAHHTALASSTASAASPSGVSAVGLGLGAGPAPVPRGVARKGSVSRRSSQQGRGGEGKSGKAGSRERSDGVSSQLIFVGTGSSMAVPRAFHLLHPEADDKKTAIAHLAVATPPEVNKNYRGNTSVLIRIAKGREEDSDSDRESESDSDDESPESLGGGGRDREHHEARVRHVQIDTGKTWREGVIRWFPRHGVPSIDGIILTHDHADAMLGLDDVRSLQAPRKDRVSTPVFVSPQTDRSVRRVFPYLVDREDDNGKGGRSVAALKFKAFQDFEPFEVGGLEVTPFPVLHGEDYVSHGFLFGPEGNKVCYISDVSRVPPESMEFLRRQGPMQLLVCDALTRSQSHPTHFSVEDSVVLAGQLKSRRTLLVGLGSDIEYHATNALLASREEASPDMPHVRLAHDGLAVDVDL